MGNPYASAQYNQANPYAGLVIPGSGPKAPTNYRTVAPGVVAPLTGGPDDPAQAARLAAAEAAARANASTPIETAAQLRLIQARAAQEIATHRALQQIDASADSPVMTNPNGPTGKDYIKSLPSATAATVNALLAGRMAFPSGAGMRSPYWQQMLAHVAQADPNFDAVNYNSRNSTRREFTAGQSAKNIKALNTAIGHLGQLDSQIGGTASHGGFPFATTVNSLVNRYERGSGDSGITNYEQTSGALASELTQVFRGSGGAEADVKRYLSELDPNASEAQKKASIKNIAGLLQSRLNAIGDQYKKGMGTTADPLVLLDDHAQNVMGNLGFGGNGGNAPPGAGPSGSGGPKLPGGPGAFDGPSSTPVSLATGRTRLENDPGASSLIDTLIRHGASADEINKSVTQLGFKPVDPNTVTSARAYLKAHPNYQGSFGLAQREVQQSALNRLTSGPIGTGVGAAVDAGMGGFADEITGLAKYPFSDKPLSQLIAEQDAKKQLAFQTNPKAAFAGQTIGNIGDMALAGGALKGTALANTLGRAAPYAGNAAYGAIEGFGQNNDNRLGGAVLGAGAAAVGTGLGEAASVPVNAALRTRPGMAFADGARRVRAALPGGSSFDNSATAFAPNLSPAQQAAAGAITKAGPDDIRAMLNQASSLNVPMSLADTAPELRELAGSAVRRSPTAAQVAENALVPRNRGQIDRFGNAIARDLGPVENIPQMSADLAKTARAKAKPLYEKAYAAGQVDDSAVNTLLQHPQLRPVLDDAHQLHAQDTLLAQANGEVPPPPLKSIVGANGEFTPPDVTAIDYIQRALRSKADAGYSGDSAAKMSAPFFKDARNLLLAKTDAAVPEFAAARAAYGGPMQSKDALEFGKRAVSMDPNALGVEVGNMAPERVGQAQIGFRSGLMDRANNVRDVSNPWEATLGTPSARKRIETMYPANPGTQKLFATRDLEKQLADSHNRIMGNSATAQRQIADNAFAGTDLGDMASMGIDMMHGGIPVTSIAKMGAQRAGLFAASKRAVSKADDLAPMLFNTDPTAAVGTVDDILQKLAQRRAFEARQNITRPMGMFGAGLGLAGVGY